MKEGADCRMILLAPFQTAKASVLREEFEGLNAGVFNAFE